MAEDKSQQSNTMGNIVNNQGIVTQGQIGNNVINRAPKPELKQLSLDRVTNSDGSQTLQALIEIVAPYPPGELLLQANAPGIVDFEVVPQRTGVMMTGHTGVRENMRFTSVISPHGQYMVVVRTSSPTNVQLTYDFR